MLGFSNSRNEAREPMLGEWENGMMEQHLSAEIEACWDPPDYPSRVQSNKGKESLEVGKLEGLPIVPPHQVHHVHHHVAPLLVIHLPTSHLDADSHGRVQVLLKKSNHASLRLARANRNGQSLRALPLVLLLHVLKQLQHAHPAHRFIQVSTLQG